MDRVILTLMVIIISLLLISQLVTGFSSRQQNNISATNVSAISASRVSGIDAATNSKNDTTPLSIRITYPQYPVTTTTGKIIIQGNTTGSGIKRISASVHVFPFKGDFPVKLAASPTPISPNKWSHWSVPLIINTTGTYRVVIAASNNAGKSSYAETTINAALPAKTSITTLTRVKVDTIPKIAFIRPTFTEAAYSNHGFYTFFYKYDLIPLGKDIKTDLDMLTVKTPVSVSELQNEMSLRHLSNFTALIPAEQKFWIPLVSHIKRDAPNAIVTVMRDEDVNDGHIFNADNSKNNAYDVLLLLHNEYVTQNEYNNLKQFVSNGGTIMFIDPNVFIAQVRYDKANHTITLVNGHDWEFNGKVAGRGITERWYNETKQWVGSNYLVNNITDNITFTNNPFNYRHFEDQFINNPKDKILLDYGIKFPKDYLKYNAFPADKPNGNITIASYTLNYGKGKVIMIGIFGENLVNDRGFLNFFDSLITNNIAVQYNKIKYYGCSKDDAASIIDCLPLTNNVASYEVIGSSTKLYNVTNSRPLFTEGKHGKALEVHGKNSESIILSDQLKLNPSEFSVSFWIKPSSEFRGLGHIISYDCDKCFPPSGWYFKLSRAVNESNQSVKFGIYNSTGGLHTTGEVIIPSNAFTHLVGIFNGSNIKIFRNGTLAAETAFDGVYNSSNSVKVGSKFYGTYPLKVGTGSYCNSCYLWTGIVDDLQIYNKALTANDIKQIYSFGSFNSNSISKDLIGNWKFDGNLNDNTGNSKPGIVSTLIGSMVFAPDGRLFFTEKNTGNIRIMKDDRVLDTPFVTIHDLYVNSEQGLLGLTIDPKFEQNRFVYLYYTYLDKYTGNPFNRVVRFSDDGNNRASSNFTVLLDKIPASIGFHSSGALAFGKDDKLYITVGDAAMGNALPEDPSSLLGKVLRINRDGTIPADNPYPNSPVYNIGHRNMYGIAFDKDGFGIVTENGANLYDEINSLEKGGDYGYPTLQPPNIAPEESINSPSNIKPLRSYKFVIVPTQAIFYDGDKIPGLKNKFLFGSLNEAIYSLDIARNKNQIMEERMKLHLFPFEGVIGLAQSPSGDIYFGDHSIYKLKSINPDSKRQTLFTIQINSSLDANFASIQSSGGHDNNSNETTITLNINKNNNDIFNSHHDFLQIRMPKDIIKYLTPGSIPDNLANEIQKRK